MNKRVEEIKWEVDSLHRQFKSEKEKLLYRQRLIKTNCTHPEIGSLFMFICPDCNYDGGPTYPDMLSDRDYENYSENIEKTRKWRRTLKAKYTREEIITMVKIVKEELRLLDERLNLELSPLTKEWEEIKLKCVHSNLRNSICQDCGCYSSKSLL